MIDQMRSNYINKMILYNNEMKLHSQTLVNSLLATAEQYQLSVQFALITHGSKADRSMNYMDSVSMT